LIVVDIEYVEKKIVLRSIFPIHVFVDAHNLALIFCFNYYFMFDSIIYTVRVLATEKHL